MTETHEQRDARLRHTPGSLLAYAMDEEEAGCACPKCGYDARVKYCPECGTARGSNNYCIQCGHIYYKAGGY